MTRFTEKSLQNELADMNEELKDAGSNIFFVHKPRNGYVAVDEFVLNEDGSKTNCLMVAGGTPREVNDHAWTRCRNIIRQLEIDKLKNENQTLKQRVDMLEMKLLASGIDPNKKISID